MSGEGPPSNCSRDDDANGHEVSADDGNSNANNNLGSILRRYISCKDGTPTTS